MQPALDHMTLVLVSSKNWTLTKPSLLNLFDQFFSLSAKIEGINRAYMVLLPKSISFRQAESFRPISLQNCPMKAISKVLTNRLQNLVDNNQPVSFLEDQ
jgi:hypothetical protein